MRLVDQLKTTALPEHTRRFTRTFQPGHPATGGRQDGRYSPDKKYRYISPKMSLCIMTQYLRHYNENCPVLNRPPTELPDSPTRMTATITTAKCPVDFNVDWDGVEGAVLGGEATPGG